MRRQSLAVFAIALSAATAFTAPLPSFRPLSALRMVAEEVTEEIPIVLTGCNIELTGALENYVRSKLQRPLEKIASSGLMNGSSCDVHLVVNKNPKVKDAHRVEVTTHLKGITIRSTEDSPDMYASIDAVADRLQRKLVKYKERRMSGYHGGKHMGDNFLESDEEELGSYEQEFVDAEAPKVTKIKSFDLGTPISLEEAIFSLDYIDHDFYVFRDIDTKEINVVYKRNAGGVGLIQPQA